MENKRPQWSTTLGFILAAIGSAVGLGNIWRFPYIMGQYGGAVFLFLYLGIILTICFVPLCCELFLGKTTKKENVGAYEEINPKFQIFGWSNVLTGVLISSFYFVVGGWILNYIWQNVINYKIEDFVSYFTQFSAEPILPCILTIAFLFLVCFFVARGVNKGIELANKIMMPIFGIILITLVITSLCLPNAASGLSFMFKPDFTKISPQMFLAALGQALFTLSIGMGAILAYGSYMKEEDKIVKSAYTIIISDTLFAILAGMMIFTAVFSFNLEPNSGASLVFITLPKIFSQIPFGNIIAILFFILLLFAALTSGISIVEVPTAALIEKFKMTRLKATLIIFGIIGLISIPATLSFGLLENFKLFNRTVFDFLDFTTSNIMLPLNTCIICLCVGHFMKDKYSKLFSNNLILKLFELGTKYVLPLILIGLIIFGIIG